MTVIQVVAGVVTKSNTYFAAKRNANKAFGGKWEFPGGKLEEGETHQSCLRREFLEEFDIDIDVGGYLGQHTARSISEPICVSFYFSTTNMVPLTSTDHDEFGFYTLDELQVKEFCEADQHALELLRNLA